MERGALRNIEQLHESDETTARMPRSVTVAFVALGGACVVFAAVALSGRKTAEGARRPDPLGDLVAQRGAPAAATSKATDLSAKDVTFPGLLSDKENPTTALAAVRAAPPTVPVTGPRGAVGSPSRGGAPPSGAATVTTSAAPGGEADDPSLVAPPPATDRLSVVPLPAQHVLQPSPIVTRPRDTLTRAATEAAQISTPPPPSAAQGHEGGYQLQVSSFRTQAEAQQFADQLRARGHKAYAVEAHVPGRGTWFRVRVGPFSSQQAAAAYRASFEAKEHVVPFIVPPAAR